MESPLPHPPVRLAALAVVAVLLAACTPQYVPPARPVDGPEGTALGVVEEEGLDGVTGASQLDLRDAVLDADVPTVARANGDDTARVTLRGLEVDDRPSIVWVHWIRPTDDADLVFRVTQPETEGLRYLTTGEVAAVSQQIVPAGADEVELLVVSDDQPWEMTAFRGGLDGLPDLTTSAVDGAGPTWFTSTAPVTVRVDLDDVDQVLRVQAFDRAGEQVSDLATAPNPDGTTLSVGADATLVLLDVDGAWSVAPVD